MNVVTWLWKPARLYRSQFTTSHVNRLREMVLRHYPALDRFICVTDFPAGLHPAIDVVQGWNDYAEIPSPHGGHNPSCYRRLRAFAPDAAATLGERFVSLDLDTVVVGNLAPLWDRPEDFVAWGETNPRSFYNGSMWLLRAGARPKVWTDFNPRTSPQKAYAAGKFGSDQGWLSYCLGKGEPTWTTADGVYSYNVHLRRTRDRALPPGARIVMFHGSTDPWSQEALALSWVKTHYR